jgi:uncharacterized ferredoxin-like protein
MIYFSDTTEKNAAMRVSELMAAAARTAPKARGVDAIKTMVLDGADKDSLAAAMREIGTNEGKPFFIRDAGNVDASHCIIIIGTSIKPRGLNCALCGAENCAAADRDGISCALAVSDLGIAVGSAAATAMDHRIDNRILFTAGMAALKLALFSGEIKVCFGIPLAIAGKNVFFDRPKT